MNGQLHAEQIERVVHPHTDADSNYWQRGDLQANAHPDHQCLADDGGHHQRNQCDHCGAPATEGHQAEQRGGTVHGQIHGQDSLLHLDIGCCLDPGVSGGEEKLQRLLRTGGSVVLLGKVLDDMQHAVERFGLVIRQVCDQRGYRALLVGDARRGNHRRVYRRVGDRLITTDG
ncbi:hypothetical protein D3C81_1655220 [compost metagenome]